MNFFCRRRRLLRRETIVDRSRRPHRDGANESRRRGARALAEPYNRVLQSAPSEYRKSQRGESDRMDFVRPRAHLCGRFLLALLRGGHAGEGPLV